MNKETILRILRYIRIWPKVRSVSAKVAPSVFCNNCIGAMVLHDYNMLFRSPFVNLWIPPSDNITLLENPRTVINGELKDISHQYPDVGHPVGLLDGKVRIFFQHYATFDEAATKWEERAQRIDYDNLRVILVERDGTTYENLKAFDALPYERKVALTHKECPEIVSTFCIHDCADGEQLDHVWKYKGWGGRKFYDEFDFKNFLFDA